MGRPGEAGREPTHVCEKRRGEKKKKTKCSSRAELFLFFSVSLSLARSLARSRGILRFGFISPPAKTVRSRILVLAAFLTLWTTSSQLQRTSSSSITREREKCLRPSKCRRRRPTLSIAAPPPPPLPLSRGLLQPRSPWASASLPSTKPAAPQLPLPRQQRPERGERGARRFFFFNERRIGGGQPSVSTTLFSRPLLFSLPTLSRFLPQQLLLPLRARDPSRRTRRRRQRRRLLLQRLLCFPLH